MVTTEALQNIVENWKTKFQILSEGIRTAQVAAETCSANIEDLHRESRRREEAQERRIQEMQIGLARFLEKCDPAHLAASARTLYSPCAPVMSTPVTQPGAPSRRRPDSSAKVPIFDGTVSAQFRPWTIQFEAIGGKSRTPGGVSDGSSSESADRHDHGTVG